MAVPIFYAPVAELIDIDEGVFFSQTIAVLGETSLSIATPPGFSASLIGRLLHVKYSGAPLLVPTVFTVTVTAGNSDGTVQQLIKFRIAPLVLSNSLSLFHLSNATGLPPDVYFTTSETIKFRVGDAIGGIWFINTVDFGTGVFTLRYISSPTESPYPGVGEFGFTISYTRSGSDVVWVGNTGAMSLNQAINLSLAARVPPGYTLPSDNIFGPTVYVKEIVDAYHIKVSATAGGAALVATRTSNIGGIAVIAVPIGLRRYPDITTPAVKQFNLGTINPSFGVSSDLDGVTWAIDNLISPWSFDPDAVFEPLRNVAIYTGIPTANASYLFALKATKGVYTYVRYIEVSFGVGTDSYSNGGGLDIYIPPAGGGGIIDYDNSSGGYDLFGRINGYLEQPGAVFSISRAGFDTGRRRFLVNTDIADLGHFSINSRDKQYTKMYVSKVTEEKIPGPWTLLEVEFLGLIRSPKDPEIRIDSDARTVEWGIETGIATAVGFSVSIVTVQVVYITGTKPDASMSGRRVNPPIQISPANISHWDAIFGYPAGTFHIFFEVWILEGRSYRTVGPDSDQSFEVTDSYRRGIALSPYKVLF